MSARRLEALVINRRGRVPHLLWTAATPFGERVWLRCRTGTTVSDLEGATEVLAVCCLAQIVRVTAHPRYPALAIVEVVREEKVWADAAAGARPLVEDDGPAHLRAAEVLVSDAGLRGCGPALRSPVEFHVNRAG